MRYLLTWLLVPFLLTALQPFEAAAKADSTRHYAQALAETKSTAREANLGYDVTTWINPTNHSKSLIFSSDQQFGLLSFNLQGEQVQLLPLGRLRHIDIRQDVDLLNGKVTLLVAANQSLQSLDLLFVNEHGIAGVAKRISLSISQPSGMCLLNDNGQLHAFVASERGVLQQWLINPGNRLAPKIIGQYKFGHPVGGCEVDDRQQTLYIAAPNRGIWRLPAAINSEIKAELIHSPEHGQQAPNWPTDLSIIYLNSSGYLLTSSPNSDQIEVYAIENGSAAVATLDIIKGGRIDSVQGGKRLHAAYHSFSEDFQHGLMVISDQRNKGSGGKSNFKLVSLDPIIDQLNN